ncbi:MULTISPECIES: hypothetical protein [Paenibacillus]|uniref:hypothetical protein n=1 Tax=Paenibacillus TaxID=44249 RepID=UPI00041D24D1|nr:hypothetical protein [Paenibacillus polymyxa]MCH6188347.1 hypothetical protein [Paenibacillus polymyxa]
MLAGFTVTHSHDIQREIWQKYIFVASMSGTLLALANRNMSYPILETVYARLKVYERLLDTTNIR